MFLRNALGICGIVVLVLPGCATITHQSATTLAVETNVQSDCTVSDKQGERRFRAPGVVAAEPKHAPTLITCTAPGHEPASLTMETSTNGAVWGNILLGGLIGYAIDAGTGNTKKFDGTARLALRPKPVVATLDAPPPGPDPEPAPPVPDRALKQEPAPEPEPIPAQAPVPDQALQQQAPEPVREQAAIQQQAPEPVQVSAQAQVQVQGKPLAGPAPDLPLEEFRTEGLSTSPD